MNKMSQVKITHLSCILNIVRIIGVLIIIETMIFPGLCSISTNNSKSFNSQ